MITIKPVTEPAVLEKLCAPLGLQNLTGYIVSDGTHTLGYSLYKVEGGITRLYWAQAEDTSLLDGVIRASVAAGEGQGAASFDKAEGCPGLDQWFQVFFDGQVRPLPNHQLMGQCCG